MSGDTVTGQALQFTNDNKLCYAFSGFKSFNHTGTTLLVFNTNTEYLNLTIQPLRSDNDSLDSQHKITFNGILVAAYPLASGSTSAYPGPPLLLVPPFTDVEIEIINVSNTSGGTGAVTLVGNVGMAPRVGNLVE